MIASSFADDLEGSHSPISTRFRISSKQYLTDGAYILLTTLGLGVSAALVAVIVERPERWDIILKFLGLFFSWPFVVLILVIAFGIGFQKQIAEYIDSKPRLVTKHVSIEPQVQQQEPPTKQPEEESKALVETDITAKLISNLEEQLKGTQQERQQLIDAATTELNRLSDEALYWRFEFLDRYLVPATKSILLITIGVPLSRDDTLFWVNRWDLEPGQAKSIEGVLLAQGLATKNDENKLVITDFGFRFLEYYKTKYGRHPQAPPAAPRPLIPSSSRLFPPHINPVGPPRVPPPPPPRRKEPNKSKKNVVGPPSPPSHKKDEGSS